MPSRDAPLDEHGFPIPQRFEPDGRDRDEERASPTPAEPSAARSALRIIVGAAVIVGLFALVFGEHAGKMFAEQFARQAAQTAQLLSLKGDYRGAAEAADRAVYWGSKGDYNTHALRASIRVRLGDPAGAVEDYNAIIERYGESSDLLGGRGFALLLAGREEEAIADCTKAIQLRGDAQDWNSRAYVRAIAGKDLEDALDDVERALEMLGDQFLSAAAQSDRAMFLDTRGYILHLMEENEQALSDLNEAIALTEDHAASMLTRRRMESTHPLFLADLRRRMDEHLAVMRRHRGDVLAALGREAEAEADRELAMQLGYSPETGVL